MLAKMCCNWVNAEILLSGCFRLLPAAAVHNTRLCKLEEVAADTARICEVSGSTEQRKASQNGDASKQLSVGRLTRTGSLPKKDVEI